MSLPHCDELFKKFLDPWYAEDDRARRIFENTRPDILTHEGYLSRTPDELAILNDEGKREVAARLERMLDACIEDWPCYLTVFGSLDENWIDAFDRYYDRERIAGVIERSDPADYGNDYLILVCEFGAALAHVLQQKQPRLVWQHDWPYWESSLIDPQTGAVIPPFHWAVKKFSDYGVEDGFRAKIDLCVSTLEKRS